MSTGVALDETSRGTHSVEIEVNVDSLVLGESEFETSSSLLPDSFEGLARDVDQRSDGFELTFGRFEERDNRFDVAAVVDNLGMAESNGEGIVGAVVERLMFKFEGEERLAIGRPTSNEILSRCDFLLVIVRFVLSHVLVRLPLFRGWSGPLPLDDYILLRDLCFRQLLDPDDLRVERSIASSVKDPEASKTEIRFDRFDPLAEIEAEVVKVESDKIFRRAVRVGSEGERTSFELDSRSVHERVFRVVDRARYGVLLVPVDRFVELLALLIVESRRVLLRLVLFLRLSTRRPTDPRSHPARSFRRGSLCLGLNWMLGALFTKL